jgi:cobalt/nickel transport system permease protein
VGAGSHGSLHLAFDSPIHRLPAQCKIAAALAFVLVVVATPREAFAAFAAYAIAIAAVAARAHLPALRIVKRLTIELPFLAFALALPFLATGERVDFGPLNLSTEGLWAAWNIVSKGTLGVATSIVLTATTPVTDLLWGLERLRVPRLFVAIAAFMVRYGDVIAGEMRRMKVARESRGHDARWIWQIRAIAHSAGTLFVRSYERGERVHLAMLSRGYTGSLPQLAQESPGPRQWGLAGALPAFAVVVLAVSLVGL